MKRYYTHVTFVVETQPYAAVTFFTQIFGTAGHRKLFIQNKLFLIDHLFQLVHSYLTTKIVKKILTLKP